jgi:hypothetical protein
MVPNSAPNESHKLPPRTKDFLDWLDNFWPHRCPSLNEPLEEIHRYAGARELIDIVKRRWTNEQALEQALVKEGEPVRGNILYDSQKP